MPDQLTPAVQDYLKAIHSLGGAERPVLPVDIAERLEVRAPSVTGMLKRLAEAGCIVYESKVGARLSTAGLAEALRVIRRHRLVELFLTRDFGQLGQDSTGDREFPRRQTGELAPPIGGILRWRPAVRTRQLPRHKPGRVGEHGVDRVHPDRRLDAAPTQRG